MGEEVSRNLFLDTSFCSMLYSITQTVICESGFHNVFLGGDVNMNFQDQIQQIFGTTDIYELKQISRDADNYRCLKADMNNSSISEKKKNTGRKNSFTEEQLAHILALQNRGEKITDIARQYHVSRQTIYSQIKRAYNFSDDPDVENAYEFHES